MNNVDVDLIFPWVILLVCRWRQGVHVGDQEQKHFSPLGTKLNFYVNSTKKMFIEHQHGDLVRCLQTKNRKISSFVLQQFINSSIIKMMLPFSICWSSWSPQSVLTVKNGRFGPMAQLYFQLTHWTVNWNRSQSTWCWADGRKPPWNSYNQAFRPKESWLYLFCRRRGKFIIHHPVNIGNLQFLRYSDWAR